MAHEDYVPLELGSYSLDGGLSPSAATNVRAFLSAGVIVRGKVWGLREVPDEDVTIYLRSESSESRAQGSRRRRGKRTRVNGREHFEIRGVESGEYTLYAHFRKSKDGLSTSVRQSIHVNEIQSEKNVQLDLSPRNAP